MKHQAASQKAIDAIVDLVIERSLQGVEIAHRKKRKVDVSFSYSIQIPLVKLSCGVSIGSDSSKRGVAPKTDEEIAAEKKKKEEEEKKKKRRRREEKSRREKRRG